MENRSLTTQVIRADHVLPAHGGLAALVPADEERPAVVGDLQAGHVEPGADLRHEAAVHPQRHVADDAATTLGVVQELEVG